MHVACVQSLLVITACDIILPVKKNGLDREEIYQLRVNLVLEETSVVVSQI